MNHARPVANERIAYIPRSEKNDTSEEAAPGGERMRQVEEEQVSKFSRKLNKPQGVAPRGCWHCSDIISLRNYVQHGKSAYQLKIREENGCLPRAKGLAKC